MTELMFVFVVVAGIDKSAKVLLRNKDEVSPGVELTLKCQVEGYPEPIIEWYKNNIR